MLKKFFNISIIIILILFTFSSQVLAEEAALGHKKIEKNSIEHLSLEEFAKKYWPLLGIDDVSQQKLINKIKKGEILDAYRPEMQAKAKVETFRRVNDK